ncbi:DUF4163 domain-containing protein [uncultured Sphingobium sp.]|uniref:DUF3298 and DUF4163 domain-containing protein n=1 Tax=uncultured Sphingobium sp. TaxID=316087 RepID=UPI0026145AC4|nr:DUF4163 domain-containing protein [uncultured Sphingobium sp.]
MRGGGVMAVAVLLAACSPTADETAGNSVSNAGATQFANHMAGVSRPPSSPAAPFSQSDKTEFLEFAYAYPAEAAAIPALVDKFRKAMDAGKADALKMAREDSESAKKAGYPFRPHSLETEWTVAADTRRFLSLRSQTYVYTGGAHGMTGYDTVLWDKERQRETSVKALMTSPTAFAAAIRDRFCAELDKQRAEKRGEPVVAGDDDFTKCIDPLDQVLVPASKDSKLIDSMTVIIGPYSAGPYAEGTYEVTIPVNAAMRKAIKTEYQDAFLTP